MTERSGFLMDDLISRKAAIDAMEQAKKQYFDRVVIIGKMQDIVNNLPSAQPEWNELMVICDNCGHAIHVKRQQGGNNG